MSAYYSQAQNKATQRYNAKAYDRVELKLYKGQKEQVKAYAESQGLSLNAYINKLIADDMGAALTVPSKQQGD
jgi:predicted HicB family RNase H-like nuclease